MSSRSGRVQISLQAGPLFASAQSRCVFSLAFDSAVCLSSDSCVSTFVMVAAPPTSVRFLSAWGTTMRLAVVMWNHVHCTVLRLLTRSIICLVIVWVCVGFVRVCMCACTFVRLRLLLWLCAYSPPTSPSCGKCTTPAVSSYRRRTPHTCASRTLASPCRWVACSFTSTTCESSSAAS